MARFYTGKGDSGYTGILGEGRLPKYHDRIEAIGAIDEASAALGLARSQSVAPGVNDSLVRIQRDLYHIMAEIAAAPENALKFRLIDENKVKWLENQVELFGAEVEMPQDFIVPGDSRSGAAFAVARTVIRKAERRVASILHAELIDNRDLLRYMNRLSSLCFVLELLENRIAGFSTSTLADPTAQAR